MLCCLTFYMSGGRRQAKQAGGRPLDGKIGPHEMLWAFLRSCQNAHCLRRQVHFTQEIGETDDQGKSGAREERAHKPPQLDLHENFQEQHGDD